jgi:hypothetical protein
VPFLGVENMTSTTQPKGVTLVGSQFVALLRENPSDEVLQKAGRLLKVASAAKKKGKLSPAMNVAVGKAIAIAIDSRTERTGDEDEGWLAENFDFFDKAAEAERTHYKATEAKAAAEQGEKMLALANTLDEAQTAVMDGIENADLKVANALDRVYEAVSESAGKFARSVVVPVVIGATVLLVAFGYARRGGGRRKLFG